LVKGGAVKVTLKDGKLAFDVTEAALPALPKPEAEGDDGGAEKLPEEVQ
jgi:ATP-dependent Clp protease ATP-binding subunit ClpA